MKHLEQLIGSDESEVAKALARDILSYIRAAYVYAELDYETVRAIDAIIGENYDDLSVPDTDVPAAEEVDGLSSAALELGSSPAFIFCIDGYDPSLYTFKVGGRAVEGEIITRDGKTYIRIALYAYAMTETVCYNIDGTDISGEYNLKAYYEFAKTLGDDALTSLVERLWRYAESAEAYRAEVNS